MDLLSKNDEADLEREKQTLTKKLKDTEEQLQKVTPQLVTFSSF